MIKVNWVVLFFGLGLFFPCLCKAQELPRGSSENCFYLMPLFEKIRIPGSLSFEEKRVQFLRMKEQLGNGNLYHRLGFSFIYGANVEAEVRQACTLAQENGVHLGLIFALQSHTREDFRNVAAKDLRLFQWRKDGVDWKGSFTSSGTIEVPEDQRDYKIPTPSRYATPLREYNTLQAKAWAESVKKLMTDFPGVVTCINGPVEEELAVGGYSNLDKLGDYSPYAITEFRDWLRHSGMYDASSGKFSGEGASGFIVGNLISFNGTLRSQFYDDPAPDDSNGTGISFNQFFGTDFLSWSLRYWDLSVYPAAITDPDFDCTPESGTGYTAGGFDAPRVLNGNPKFWSAWTYDMPDQSGFYPPGNPESPAFGFRQHLTRNLVRDLFDLVASSGIPRKMMYAHQIPGDVFLGFTGAGARNRSSASTVWSGYLEKSQTVGITRFGGIDPSFMTQYANDWGIFEWHTLPNVDPNSLTLYNTSKNALTSYYSTKCHYLFPGWWKLVTDTEDKRFPLNDSKFAEAIRDFLKTCAEVPYHQQGTVVDYTPPQVSGLSGKLDENKQLSVSWNDRIWPELLQKWVDWSQFATYEIQKSTDGVNWSASEKLVQASSVSVIEGTSVKVRVRSLSKMGLAGPWSEVLTLQSQTTENKLNIRSEYNSLFADPEMNNKITVSPGDPSSVMDWSKLSVSITGEGQILNTAPEKAETIEKFWPMDSSGELSGIFKLENGKFAGGLYQAVVSAQTPIDPYFSFSGSAINGAQLPYVAFRLYSDKATTGQLFWFPASGNKSVTFPINQGWNVYSFSNLPEWVAQTTIKSVRLDPGLLGSAKIGFDWMAISSQPITSNLVPSYSVQGNELTFFSSPTASPGAYTVTVTLDKLQASVTVQTRTSNQRPTVTLYSPTKDTIVELGTPVRLLSEPKDPDGQVAYVTYFANTTFIQASLAPPYLLDWIPDVPGSYELIAEAVDNAFESGRSAVRTIQVVEQIPFSGKAVEVPGKIEAEEYDTGGKGISWFDNDLLNRGGVYRTDAVDVFTIAGSAKDFFVNAEAGEWMEYSIEVRKAMKVDISLLVACKAGGGEIHLELNDQQLTNRLFLAASGEDQQFKMLSFKDIYLQVGIHKLKVVIDKGEMNLDYLLIGQHFPTVIRDILFTSENRLVPNPARDEVRLSRNMNQTFRIRILSLQGQLIKEIPSVSGTDPVFSVSGLPVGVYLVWIIGDGGTFMEKLIKL